MKISLKRKKPSHSQRQSRKPSDQSLPVNRYYSHSHDNSAAVGRQQDVQKRQARARASSVTHAVVRWSGVILVVLLLMYNASLLSTGNKIIYQNSRNESPYRSNEEYKRIVEEVFNRSVFNKTKLTFSSHNFEEALRSELPEIDHTSAVVPLVGTRLQVGLSVSETLLRLRDTTDNSFGLIGDSGTVIQLQATDDTIGNFIDVPIMTLTPSIGIEEGAQILTQDEVALVSLLIREFDGSEPYRPRIKSFDYRIEQREFQVEFFAHSFFARLTTERSVREQVGALIAVLQERSLADGQVNIPEYIDVRVDGRVFVK